MIYVLLRYELWFYILNWTPHRTGIRGKKWKRGERKKKRKFIQILQLGFIEVTSDNIESYLEKIEEENANLHHIKRENVETWTLKGIDESSIQKCDFHRLNVRAFFLEYEIVLWLMLLSHNQPNVGVIMKYERGRIVRVT